MHFVRGLCVALDDMKRVILFSALAVATGCAAVEPVSESEPTVTSSRPATTQAEHPLLTFDVVPIHIAGVAEEIAIRRSEGGVPLLKGPEISNGSRLQFAAGSRLRILFPSNERAEIRSSDKERWVVFEVVARR